MNLRYFSVVILLLLVCFSCRNNKSTAEQTKVADDELKPTPMTEVLDTQQIASMDFDTKVFNFPDAHEGTVVKKYFSFVNSSETSLVIKDVRTSCGCTTAQVPQEPIPPGKKDSLLVEFDTNGRMGYNSKAITVVANTNPATQHLFLKGNVIK